MQLKEGSVYFVPQFEGSVRPGGKVWHQEREAVGRIMSTARKKRVIRPGGFVLSLFHLVWDPSPEMAQPTFRVTLPNPVNPI